MKRTDEPQESQHTFSHSERKGKGDRKGEKYPISEARFWTQRLSKTGLRALHILGVAASSGGILYGVDKHLWLGWWMLAMSTGLIMMTLEITRSRLWIIQLKGVLTFVKLGLLASFWLIPQHKPVLFISILVMSVFIAHGPAGLRHYSIWHRRRIDEKRIVNG
ncbi:hypothetical protein [Photobacterium lipolyticum]|uniref:hypothetical protein n=1 Tax=Photobacterium lipolyticum TaxID=266810 RepID=UPI001FE800BA|nr:hypothetical protein [Photobacterium lipolyticum]